MCIRDSFRGSSGFLDACDSAYVLTEVMMNKDRKRVPRTAKFMHLKNRHIGGETIHPIFLSFEDSSDKQGMGVAWKEWKEVENEYNDQDGEASGDAISSPFTQQKKTPSNKPKPSRFDASE